MRMITRKPGLQHFAPMFSGLGIGYTDKVTKELPEAYSVLLFDIVAGYKGAFASAQELEQSWRILTPLLKDIELKKVQPLPYPNGSTGPSQVDTLLNTCKWKQQENVVCSDDMLKEEMKQVYEAEITEGVNKHLCSFIETRSQQEMMP